MEKSEGEYLSGSMLAKKLGVTRAAVWKNIRQLQAEGYKIEAVTNRGYRLGREQDSVSEAGIRKALGELENVFTLEMYDVLTSTNTVMKERADSLPEWTVIISSSQTAGRGRIGRSFYSPSDSGIYLSVLLRPALPASEATRITTAAAVAACRAIESCTAATPSIKWVNDVFVNGKKVCGILTEGSLNMETGGLDWAVMGIGLDVYEPDGGFPEEIRERPDGRYRLLEVYHPAGPSALSFGGSGAEWGGLPIKRPHPSRTGMAYILDYGIHLRMRLRFPSTWRHPVLRFFRYGPLGR